MKMRPLNFIAGKRAQITVFMIIGIILLFSSAILFYIRGQTSGVSSEFIPVAQEVPLEAQPVKIFVEDCLKKVGTEGLVQLGLHGGYIDPTDEAITGTTFLMGYEPTESDVLSLSGSLSFTGPNKMLMPYWFYLKSANDCKKNCGFGTNRPALRKGTEPSVEGQLDKYIERNIATCLRGFKDFIDQGFVIETLGPLKSDSRVAEKNFLLLLNYPLRVSLGERKTDISSFISNIDVNFKDIYNMASDISDHEAKTFFLEVQAMNLISMYSQPSSVDKIPPVSEVTFGYSDHKIWTRTATQRKLESEILPGGISMLQVDQSRNFVRRMPFTMDKNGKYQYDAMAQGILDRTILILNSSKNYTDISATFTYLDWWPIYLDINHNEVIGPSSAQGAELLSFLAINQYRNWYSMSFPVMVTLQDDNALAGKGYKFNFALEGNIRENNHSSTQYMDLAKDYGKKMACNVNQKNSGEYMIETQDAYTKEPVPARVDFLLGNEACFVGFTAIDENNRTTLKANLPVGFGLLKITNSSYIQYQERIISRLDTDVNMTVDLSPFREINATIYVRTLQWNPLKKDYELPASQAPMILDPKTEKAMIMFKKVNDDGTYGTTTMLAIEKSIEPQLLKLVPGKYELRGFLMWENAASPIKIPKKIIEFSALFGLSKTEVELNETIMDQYMDGGINLNNETGLLEIKKDDLFNSKQVVFYLLRFPLPRVHIEALQNGPGIEQIGKIPIYSNIYRSQLEPDWME